MRKTLKEEQWDRMSWEELKKRLTDDPEYLANREVARRVVNNYQAVVEYFLNPMSKGIVESLNKMMGRDTFSDYYIFISHPYNEETQTPEWHKIGLYDARDCSLISYSSRISHRHFSKIAKKERIRSNSEGELLEYCDYEALLNCDQPEIDGEDIAQICMRKAYEMLKERDQKVLQYLVIDKMAGGDAFLMLADYIHPLPKDGMSSDEVKSTWSIKQKQDAVSLMKGRALKYLLAKYIEIKHNTKI